MSKDTRHDSYKILTETGQELERNRRHLIDCKDQGNFEVEKSKDCERETISSGNNIEITPTINEDPISIINLEELNANDVSHSVKW